MLPPSLLLPFVVLLLTIPILYRFMFPNNRRKKASSEPDKIPPGPAQLPIIGNLHQLLAVRSLHRTLFELSKKHGPLMHLKFGRVPALVISSAEMAKELLKKHDEDCCNRPPWIAAKKLTYGFSDVIYGAYSERWKERRRILMEELLSNKKLASMKSAIEEEMAQGMRWFASETTRSPAVDVSESSFNIFNNIICKIAFGRTQFDSNMENMQFIREIQSMFSGSFMGDYFPQLGWVDVLTGMRGRLNRVFLKLDSFYQQLIKEHEELNQHRGNILDALLHVRRDTKNLTEDEIKGLLMNIYLAGTETATATVEWAMTELMRHPEDMRKAQDEVRRCIGKRKLGKVVESDIRQLRYLKAVIKETMRVHPSVPLLVPREAIRGFKLHGYDVAPKTTIYINSFAITREPKAWERPEEFMPERFLDAQSSGSTIDMCSNHDFNFLPFGEGRRICAGLNLGLLVTELALANLLYCFDWKLPAGTTIDDIDMGEGIGLGIHRSSGLYLVATKYDALEE